MLRVEVESVDQKVVLRCSGRIVYGVEVEMLRCMVTSRSEKHIVLDLEGVLGVDAAGIGAMVELKQWSSLQGRSLSLANVNGNIMRLLRIVGVDGLISVKAPKDSEASQPHAADELLARMMHAMSA